jgi:hypothetical protein
MLKEMGGSMELAVVELQEPERMRELVVSARNRERLGAGALGTTRVAVYKRETNGDAAARVDEILRRLEATGPPMGVGVVVIGGSGLPAVEGRDLIHLAELSLDEALQSGGGTQRLVLQHEAAPLVS